MQYRGEILPLIHLDQVLRRPRQADGRLAADSQSVIQAASAVQVIVVAGKEHRVGLVVDRIVDIAEEALVVRSSARRPGVLFTAVIQSRVTEFLDVDEVLRSADAEMFDVFPLPTAEV
jgi:two-component system chemotaxis sensor kinase CheA